MTGEHMTIRLKGPDTSESPTPQEPQPVKKIRRGRRMFAIIFLLSVGVLLLAAVAFGIRAVSTGALRGGESDPKQMVIRVSRLMMLPDEAPTIAVVSDLEKLKGQLFFAHAKVGDVVLMYPRAQKAILYSPTLDKIIEVAPITNDTQQ